MVKNNINLYLGANNLEKFEYYCEKSGRKLSPLVVRAVEEYIVRNPLK